MQWIIQMREGLLRLDSVLGIQLLRAEEPNKGKPRGLSRAALLKTYALHGRGRASILGDGVLEAVENFVSGVLQAGIGLVQLAGRLGGQLAEFVAVCDVGESSKNEV